jgi:DNA-binding CsgD family transcriptional regulator
LATLGGDRRLTGPVWGEPDPRTGKLRDSSTDGIPYFGFMIDHVRTTTDRCKGDQDANDLRRELLRVLAGDAPSASVRAQIVDSWRQSAALGLGPDRFDPPYDGGKEEDPLLLLAALPIVDRLGADLALTEISVVLSGSRGRLVACRAPGPIQQAQLNAVKLSPGYLWGIEHAGTNGVGGALAYGSPLLVQGGEHFADALTTAATAGAPIHDPRTGAVLGSIGLVCSVEAANPLLLPMVTQAAREAEQQVLKGYPHLDRLLQERFLEARRRTRGPLAAVSRGALLTNAAAAHLLTEADRTRLWDFAWRGLGATGTIDSPFILADGRGVALALEGIFDGGAVVGMLVRFPTMCDVPSSRRPVRTSRSSRPTYGWDSLTEAEQSVTDLVADGLTNRQVASRLFLSPHTVDSHLRHIFRKLDINSRVELVRIVTTRSIANRELVGTADVA